MYKNDDGSSDGDAYIAAQLVKWDRALLIVSIPHGAAFGAYVGKYDFRIDGQADEASFVSISLITFLLPVVTVWLFYVYDLMRNVFLRLGHLGILGKIRHTIAFLMTFAFPLILAIIAIEYRNYVDSVSLALISMTMFSWMFCLVLISNDLYLKMAKALGIQTDE